MMEIKQPAAAAEEDAFAAAVDRFARQAADMSRDQRTVLFFAISRAMFDDFEADPAADQRWVAAAHATWVQIGTLLIRAKGYTTEALQLEAAIARASGVEAARH